jgi:hypothetical protein
MKRQHTHINRDNYEVWFMDHLEGQLSAAENALLQKFLLENADLSIELENLTEITLQAPASTGFPNKALLKKASAPFSELSAYDHQMVKALEEGLSVPEHIHLSSEAAQNVWALYQKTRLQAAVLEYPHKNKLKRHRMAFMPAALRAVAAAILLLILFNVKVDMPEPYNSDSNLVAVTETTPAIEHTPVLTHEEPVIQVVPVSSTAQDFMVTANHITIVKTVEKFIPGALEEIPATLPGPKVATLPTPRLPNSYETGLQLMLPMYVENHQLMASLSDQVMPRMAEPDTKTLLSRTTDLIKQVTPFNLTYNKVYDADGELVAINLSGDNFEVAQRVPKWWGAK